MLDSVGDSYISNQTLNGDSVLITLYAKVRRSETHLRSVNEQNMMFYKSDYCQINEMKTRTLSGGGVEFVRRYLSLILSEGYGRMALWFLSNYCRGKKLTRIHS